MKVICIDNTKLIELEKDRLVIIPLCLTIGKAYNVVDRVYTDCFGLFDDTNTYRIYRKSSFVLVSEVRKAKLSKIK